MDDHGKLTPARKRLRSTPSSGPGSIGGDTRSSSDDRHGDQAQGQGPAQGLERAKMASHVRNKSVLSSCSQTLLGQIHHEWDAIYIKKALLARVVLKLTTLQSGAHKSLALKQSEASIAKVKFYTKKSHQDQASDIIISEFDVCREPSRTKTAFENHLITSGIGFPKRKDVPDSFVTTVNNLKAALQKSKLHYHNKATGRCHIGWSLLEPVPDVSALPIDIQCLASSVRTAFIMDIMNGSAKQCFQELFHILRATVGIGQHHLKIWQPSAKHGTTTKVEILSVGDSTNYNRSLEIEQPIQTFCGEESADSSGSGGVEDQDLGLYANLLPYPFLPPRGIVSDGQWSTSCLKNPEEEGRFILTLEVKPEHRHDEAVFQCYKQILSKLHCQRFLMGLAISPLQYTYLMAYKVGGDLHISSYSKDLVKYNEMGELDRDGKTIPNGCQSLVFDVDEFGEMLFMLGRLLLYAKQLVERE